MVCRCMLDPFVDAVVGFQFLGRDAVRPVPAAFKPKTALRKQCEQVGAIYSFSTELHFIVAIRLPSLHCDKSVGSQERKDRQKKRTHRLAKFTGRNLLASQRGPFVIWKLISRYLLVGEIWHWRWYDRLTAHGCSEFSKSNSE